MKTAMTFDQQACEAARLSRDARFDGMFFTGVHSTGIFCRPICPAPAPKPENVRYYRTAAAAFKAGLRPCLRCRPEAAPGSLGWNYTEPLLAAAVELIRSGYLAENTVAELAARIGLSARHLRRLFQQQLGTTPLAYARMQQLLFAKQLLNESRLSITDVAMAAGFGSVRRFNDLCQSVYQRTPGQLRRGTAAADKANGCRLQLTYQAPFDFKAMLAFYRRRQIEGVEFVDTNSYSRSFELDSTVGWFRVTNIPGKNAVQIELHANRYDQLQPIVQRIRRMLDLDARPQDINRELGQDTALQALVIRHPGLRIPGCWSVYEACVRAVLGQRVSLTASVTMLQRLVNTHALSMPTELLSHAQQHITAMFPAPAQLQRIKASQSGIGQQQADCLQRLTTAQIASGLFPNELLRTLQTIKGIGDWTANYVLLRGLGYPDAWLESDVVLRNMRQQLDLNDSTEWQPWRGYAVMHLWKHAENL